jgi:hypothetical protein
MTHYALCWTVHGDCDLCCNGVYDCLNLTWNHALLLASVLISDAMNTRPLVSRATKRMWAICSDFDVWMLRFVEIVILFNLIHHIIFSLLFLWLCISFKFHSAENQNFIIFLCCIHVKCQILQCFIGTNYLKPSHGILHFEVLLIPPIYIKSF